MNFKLTRQGIMGEIYAANQKYNKEISQAIREHYLPRFGDDVLPKSQTGKILALADKIYTICALRTSNKPQRVIKTLLH